MRFIRSLGLCLPLLAGVGLPATLHSQAIADREGTLGLIWADPRPGTGTPFRIYTLRDSSGALSTLAMDASMIAVHGGPRGLDGARVRVRGTMSHDGATIQVNSIVPLRAPGDQLHQRALATLQLASPTSRPYLTLLCRFPDRPVPAPASHFERLVEGDAFPSVRHYWGEASNGAISLVGGAVRGWVDLPQPYAEYVLGESVSLDKAGRDCIEAARPLVHYPSYVGVNLQFNESLGCCSYAGAMTIATDGQERTYAATWLSDWATNAFGVYAHEIGHTLGLDHSTGPYGDTYDSMWDVMSMPGGYLVEPGINFGAHTLAIQKQRLGVLPASRIVAVTGSTEQVFLLERSAMPGDNGNPLLIRIPIPGRETTSEYYTVEARRRVGYDAGLPGDGVIIHRVGHSNETRVVDVDGNGNPNDDGALWVPGERFFDPATDISVRVEASVGDAYRVTVRGAAPQAAIRVVSGPRHRTSAFGAGDTHADSASVVIDGSGADTVRWSVIRLGRRIHVENASGVGSGTIRWSERNTSLAPGTHVDTLVVIASGALGSPVRVIDTLVVTAPATAALGLEATSASDSLISPSTSWHAVTVVPSGPDADTIAWTAQARMPWLVIDEGAGAGTGRLTWRHVSSSLAPGVHHDTIVVTAAGVAGEARLPVTLRVLAPPVITLERSGGARRASFASAPMVDSIRVTFTGEGAASQQWNAFNVSGATQLYLYPHWVPQPNVGSGWLRLRWEPGIVPPGTWVNKVAVRATLGGDAVVYEDTLHIDAAPASVAVSAASRRDTVLSGSSGSLDSVWVQSAGEGGPSRGWYAQANAERTTFLRRGSASPGSSMAPGWLVWARNTAATAEPGAYVDTIVVALQDDPAIMTRVIDSLIVMGPATVVLAPSARSSVFLVGHATPVTDSATVTVAGFRSEGLPWSASSARPWNTITSASGSGAGMLRWRRSVVTLEPGVHVDTITVSTEGPADSPVRLLDSVRVVHQLALDGDSVRRAGVMGAAYADTLHASGGTGGWRWSVTAGALPTGVSLDSVTGVLHGIPGAAGIARFTVRVRSDTFTVARAFRVDVAAPVLSATAVLDHLLGGPALPADHVRYLDLQGNRNGRADVGDVRAWLNAPGVASTPAVQQRDTAALAALRALGAGTRSSGARPAGSLPETDR